VYGASLALGDRREGRAQHQGLGTRLIDEASAQARERGYGTLSVISAIGTRGYYRRRGFIDGELYQHRAIT
jgi:elongator complex protein 3